MGGRLSRITTAGLVGLLSAAAAIYSGVLEQQRLLVLANEMYAQLAPIPPGLVPAGAVVVQPSEPLTVAEHNVIAGAMRRDPLDIKLFNLIYANSVRTGAPAATVQREAGLLAKLGWRFTPTQQNLIVRAALNEDVDGIVDRADGLLRRKTLPALSFAMLAVIEAIPQTSRYVAAKLLGNPPWRQDYLSVINPQSPRALLEGRIRTLEALLKGARSMTREEISPSLVALTATGHGRAAYRLWLRQSRRPDGANLVSDPDFRQASNLLGTDGNIPFEWKLGRGIGYSVQASTSGAAIEWDQHGVPLFMAQLVPVAAGQRYVLTIAGVGAPGVPLSSLLAPTIDCGTVSVHPDRTDSRNGWARYAFPALPPACDLGQLTLSGALDVGTGNASFTIAAVRLQRIR